MVLVNLLRFQDCRGAGAGLKFKSASDGKKREIFLRIRGDRRTAALRFATGGDENGRERRAMLEVPDGVI